MKPHRAILILVFGILGIVSCMPLGIAAWVMGNRDLKEMDAGTMDPGGRGNTNAGRICGMIGTLLATVLLVVWFAVGLIWVFWQSDGLPPNGPAPQSIEEVAPKLPTAPPPSSPAPGHAR